MITSYKLRIDLDIEWDLIQEFLDTYVSMYALCFEKMVDNPHCHLLIHSNENNRTLRSALRKIGLKGNRAYSLVKIKDNELFPIEYIAYMMKQGSVYMEQLPDEVLQEAKEYDTLVKAAIKKAKDNKTPIWRQILEEYLDEDVKDFTIDRFGIQESIVKYHFDKKLLLRKFQAKAYYDTILMHLTYKYGSPSDIQIFIDRLFE